MPLDEYMEEQGMEFRLGRFKTYTLKEYNLKFLKGDKYVHEFWDLSG